MFRRLCVLCVILFLMGLLAACGNSGGSTANGGKKYTIGLSVSTLNNAFFVAMDKGVRDETTRLGLNLIDTNANGDASTQVNQVEDLITKKVNLLILNPINARGIVPVVQQANTQKIPVITLDRGSDGGTVTSFLETDNVAMGKEAVDWIAIQMTARYGSPKGNVVDLQGLRGTTAAEEREQGFMQEMQKYPNLKLIASQAANFDQERAYNVTSDILQSHSQIDVIFGANDDNTVGALKAIQAAHRDAPIGNSKHIVIIGIDGIEQALASIRNGTIDATISQNPLKMAAKGVDFAQDTLNGHRVQAHFYYPHVLITKANINSPRIKSYGLWADEVTKANT